MKPSDVDLEGPELGPVSAVAVAVPVLWAQVRSPLEAHPHAAGNEKSQLIDVSFTVTGSA